MMEYALSMIRKDAIMEKRETPDEEMTVELELDEGTVTCEVITIFSVGDKDYIALLPKGHEEDPEGGVWIYGYKENEEDPNEEPELIYIDDEAEYEAAADAFDEYLDECEFDEMQDE